MAQFLMPPATTVDMFNSLRGIRVTQPPGGVSHDVFGLTQGQSHHNDLVNLPHRKPRPATEHKMRDESSATVNRYRLKDLNSDNVMMALCPGLYGKQNAAIGLKEGSGQKDELSGGATTGAGKNNSEELWKILQPDLFPRSYSRRFRCLVPHDGEITFYHTRIPKSLPQFSPRKNDKGVCERVKRKYHQAVKKVAVHSSTERRKPSPHDSLGTTKTKPARARWNRLLPPGNDLSYLLDSPSSQSGLPPWITHPPICST